VLQQYKAQFLNVVAPKHTDHVRTSFMMLLVLLALMFFFLPYEMVLLRKHCVEVFWFMHWRF
jgi:hypothetical protein